MDTLSTDQLQAMLKMSKMTPNQSAGALGHSNGMLTNMISGAKSIAGDVANEAVRGVQSAVRAPGDIVAGLQGKAPDTSTLPNFTGEGQQTFQGEFASKTLPAVEAGKESPIAATLKTVGGVLGSALDFVGLGIGGKAAAKAAPKVVEGVAKGTQAVVDVVRPPVALATKRLAATADTMTKKELEEAASRVTPKGKITPSTTEQRAGELLQGKTYANPVKTLKSVSGEIATRGKAAETHLEQNVKAISNQEDFNAFQSARASSEKYMTATESKAYDEQVGVFQKILKDYTKGGGYTTDKYYKALKDYESQVTANLAKGKDALLVPGGSARIQAAKDVRSVVRDMIGEKNPEFKGEMFDLASLYDVQDNVVGQVADKAKGSVTWSQRHPTLSKIGIGAAGVAADKLLKDTTGFGI